MNCMKCGVEIPENQVFCDHCLSEMESFPIKPGTHIHLPKQALTTDAPRKAPKKKRSLSQEEQLSALRLKVQRLRLVAAVLAFLLCLVSVLFLYKLQRPTSGSGSATGRNYTIDTSMNK